MMKTIGRLVVWGGILWLALSACGRGPATPVPAQPEAAEQPTATPLPQPVVLPTSPVATPVSPVATPRTEIGGAMENLPDAPEVPALLARAREILAQVPGLNLQTAQVTVQTMEAQEWRDASLGCPREGMMYAQVITPGYLLVMTVDDRTFEFHTDRGENVVLCTIDGEDASTVLGE